MKLLQRLAAKNSGESSWEWSSGYSLPHWQVSVGASWDRFEVGASVERQYGYYKGYDGEFEAVRLLAAQVGWWWICIARFWSADERLPDEEEES